MKPELPLAAAELGAAAEAVLVPKAGLLCALKEAPPLAPKEKPDAGPLPSPKAEVPGFGSMLCSVAGAFATDPKTGAAPPPNAGALPEAPNTPAT